MEDFDHPMNHFYILVEVNQSNIISAATWLLNETGYSYDKSDNYFKFISLKRQENEQYQSFFKFWDKNLAIRFKLMGF
jgi:hypothetical protein